MTTSLRVAPAARTLVLAAAVALVALAGCARGGGTGTDARVPGLDGGTMPPIDAQLPPIDAPPVDTGTTPVPDTGTTPIDSGPIDSGPIDSGPPRECTVAADCNDGLVCNGIERCESNRCVAGTAVTCDDGIACTRDGCSEPAGTCTYAPDSTLCAAGQTCSMATGCTGGGSCSESPCRLRPTQCGCGTGQGCYVNAGARMCLTAGTGGLGAACTVGSDCRAGFECLNYSATGSAAACARYCATDADCGSGSLCLQELSDGAGGSLPGATLCTTRCDPVASTGCPTGSACTFFQESAGAMRIFAECAGPVGSGGQGAICTDDTDCRAGFACIDTGFGTECVHWCNYDTGAGCSGLTFCTPFPTPVIYNGFEYGVCT